MKLGKLKMDFYTDFACGMVSKHITDESLDCPDYTQFMEEVLTPLLMQYEPQNVYNADETSLYYKCLPNRTYEFEHERVRVFPIWLNSYWSNYCWSNDFFFIFVLLRPEDQSNGTPRTVLVSCLLLT